jgi:anti-sigma B factor antagonist
VLLEVTVEKPEPADPVWLISLTGELDFHSAPRFRRAFTDTTPPAGDDVVLDLSELAFLDSSGLAAVIELYLLLERAGARLVVVSTRAPVTRVFTVTAIDRFVHLTPTREQAIASMH